MRAFLNPSVRRDDVFRGLFDDADYRDVHAYFAAHPELVPTPLRPLTSLASRLGIATIDAKDETHRFGVNAFKIVGVRYAFHRLGDEAVRNGVVCATAGNHGRAVARVARQKHVACTVFVPALKTLDSSEQATRDARTSAMRADGATVHDVSGTYEDAVARAARFAADTGAAVVSDTSWDGYEKIPRWIMAGYTQLLEEASTQWDAEPTVVLIQGGVGGLVCAAACWFAWRFGARRPFLIACEPEHAACLLASAEAGRVVTIDDSLDTIMAGLRCASPSPAAWPAIAHGIDAFVAVSDERVRQTLKALADERVHAGPSGACGVAALQDVVQHADFAAVREAAGLDRSSRALVVITEGA
jgi:diaminopropionate ammonia-lyase